VVVRRGLGIHQPVTSLGHGFTLERVATTLVIGDEKKKTKSGAKNVDDEMDAPNRRRNAPNWKCKNTFQLI